MIQKSHGKGSEYEQPQRLLSNRRIINVRLMMMMMMQPLEQEIKERNGGKGENTPKIHF